MTTDAASKQPAQFRRAADVTEPGEQVGPPVSRPGHWPGFPQADPGEHHRRDHERDRVEDAHRPAADEGEQARTEKRRHEPAGLLEPETPPVQFLPELRDSITAKSAFSAGPESVSWMPYQVITAKMIQTEPGPLTARTGRTSAAETEVEPHKEPAAAHPVGHHSGQRCRPGTERRRTPTRGQPRCCCR